MILFFDTETTGLPNWGSPSEAQGQPYMVQYCGLLMDQNRRVIAALSTLINPQGLWEIPADMTAIHGISTAQAQAYGMPLAQALAQHKRLYQAADVVVGHNLDFDKRIIRIQYAKVGRKEDAPEGKPEFCTMKAGTDLCRIPGRRGGYKWPRLEELHAHLFGQAFAGAHDAMTDVTATAKCYYRMAEARTPMAVVGTEAQPGPAEATVTTAAAPETDPAPAQAKAQDDDGNHRNQDGTPYQVQGGPGQAGNPCASQPGQDIGIGARA